MVPHSIFLSFRILAGWAGASPAYCTSCSGNNIALRNFGRFPVSTIPAQLPSFGFLRLNYEIRQPRAIGYSADFLSSKNLRSIRATETEFGRRKRPTSRPVSGSEGKAITCKQLTSSYFRRRAFAGTVCNR